MKLLSCVWLFVTPWTIAYQAPLSMGFSRQEWVAIPFPRGSSWPRDRTWVSHVVGRCFTVWTIREVKEAHWKQSYVKPRQCIKKQRCHFANKCPSSQSYGFSSSHVEMRELDHKEGWALRKWWFWIVVLEKTLQNPVDCKKIKQVNPKGNQPWVFIGRTDAEASVLWPPDVKN